MELAICKEFKDGKLTFKNAQLKTATNSIVENMNKARKGFLAAGLALKKINDEKLYEKDFFGVDGKPSFAVYVETVLGISKTTAYRIIKTTDKILAPEMLTENKPKFFENFTDGALDILSGLDDYDKAMDFCKAYDVTETTPREMLRKYVKAYKNGVATLAEYAEYESNKNAEVDAEGETIDDAETTENVDSDTVSSDREYLNLLANFFKADINSILDICSSREEEYLIKEVVKKYATI